MIRAWEASAVRAHPHGRAVACGAPLARVRWLATGGDDDAPTGEEGGEEEIGGSGDLMSTDVVVPDHYPNLIAIPVGTSPLFPRFVRVLTVTECAALPTAARPAAGIDRAPPDQS